jgi:hypothetical protein
MNLQLKNGPWLDLDKTENAAASNRQVAQHALARDDIRGAE